MINNDFWMQRWQEGQIGFHRNVVNPKLTEFADQLIDANTKRVYVPLCGKTLDMSWLADQGLHVVGCELSPLAIHQFFEERDTEFEQKIDVYHSSRFTLYQRDFFELDPSTQQPIEAIYDRAAMVAIGYERQTEYARHLLKILAPGGKILLVSFDYDRLEMNGPPFAVADEVVRKSFAGAKVDCLSKRSILEEEPKFKNRGLSRLSESVWLIQKQCK
jgi:thiopurine S-methyltransferase